MASGLRRGACVHWAHPHAGSKLVSKACKLAAREFGWKVFYAYSDEHAGEIGTIYQACNWLYLGRGVGRGAGNTSRSVFYKPDGTKLTSKSMRAWLKKSPFALPDDWWLLEAAGWTRTKEMDKHKYVTIVAKGREREELLSHIAPLEYPKRG